MDDDDLGDVAELRLDEKRQRAIALHLAGVSYEKIAQSLGYHDASGAHKAVTAGLAAVAADDAAVTLQLELMRLDDMLLGVWRTARAGSVPAINAALKIMDRRARYLGLNAAELGGTGPQPPTEQKTELDRLREERARRAQASG